MSTATWCCIGASVTGVRHTRNGKPCQDHFGYTTLPTGEVVIAVSDGAGSAPLAAEGSHALVESALAAVAAIWEQYRPASRKAWRDVIRQAFGVAQQRLALRAAAAGHPPRAYAATLLVVIVSKEVVVCGLVGDCAAVAVTDDGVLHSLCAPQRGQYANTTYFATHHDLDERLDVQLLARPVQGVALFSDGLLALAMNIEKNQPYAPFFTPLFAFATEQSVDDRDKAQAEQELAAFLDSERVNQRTHDDKTLVLVTRLRNGT
ncbi:MAG: PP2C family serine/threonine-protein phosphatase [Caldilineaceae bacterium]